jgi:hypothetical protein
MSFQPKSFTVPNQVVGLVKLKLIKETLKVLVSCIFCSNQGFVVFLIKKVSFDLKILFSRTQLKSDWILFFPYNFYRFEITELNSGSIVFEIPGTTFIGSLVKDFWLL